MLYGAAALIILFALRSIGNTVSSLAWIKNLTPFGWIDKLRPFYHAQAIWFLPLVALTLICVGLAVYLAGKRDMGDSFIADSDSAKPRFKLLGSQLGLDFRLSRNVMAGWLLGSVGFATLIASIDKTVAKTLSGTGAGKGKLIKTFNNLTGNPNSRIEIAYLSAAGFLIVTLLLIMVTNFMGTLREEEASGRLDNIISGTTSRGQWLAERLLLIVGGVALITLISDLVVWAVAGAQGINVSFPTMVFGGLNILGPVMLLLGLGVLLYGLMPKLTVYVMYAIIAWSFTIDVIAAALKLGKTLGETSLLHYVSFVPAASPNWRTFSILSLLGVAGICCGVIAFERRDTQSE